MTTTEKFHYEQKLNRPQSLHNIKATKHFSFVRKKLSFAAARDDSFHFVEIRPLQYFPFNSNIWPTLEVMVNPMFIYIHSCEQVHNVPVTLYSHSKITYNRFQPHKG